VNLRPAAGALQASAEAVDVVVVGAGAVGLACAAELARRGRQVLVLERHAALARETSSHNSQVIHAGLYYPRDSQKARCCVRGRELLYQRCAELRIPHRQTGKLVVATEPQEMAALEALRARGETNGAPGLEMLDGAAVAGREPAVRARAGLLSPRSGIVDAHALCLSWAAELEAAGGELLFGCEVLALSRAPRGWRITARSGAAPPALHPPPAAEAGAGQGAPAAAVGGAASESAATAADFELADVEAAAVVNAAGLWADRVAALAGVEVEAAGYRIHPCKGDYFALAPAAPLRFSHLVYPIHGRAGLGVHITLDLAGRVLLGPDANYVARPDYAVDEGKAAQFAAAAGRYLPGLRAEWLSPDQAGVRPKLAGPGESFRDFVVAEESARGLPGLVNLVGIESPGLTAAPAIAEQVAGLLASL